LAGEAVTAPEGADGQDVTAGGTGVFNVDGEAAVDVDVGAFGTLEQAVRKATIAKKPHFKNCWIMAS
jgi:hypothetical protein